MHVLNSARLFQAVAVIGVLSVFSSPSLSQRGGGGGGIAVGLDLAAPIAPLNQIVVPDVNMLGILDGAGSIAGAAAWAAPTGPFGGPITETGNRLALQQLGKALFWDMQVGGDGIQACATCHYHAGADNRKTNQMSPGLKMTLGGPDIPASDSDTVHDLFAVANSTLTATQYSALDDVNAAPIGCPVSEPALVTAGSTPDDPNGTSGVPGPTKPDPAVDVNDVASSQGVRDATYEGLSGGRVDQATLEVNDAGFDGFNTFTVTQRADSATAVETVRRVEPRNSPTAVNAVYHMRNFWDGRADMFFNGVTPLGFRDTESTVKTFSGGLGDLPLRIPFSSLASQAVGPIESDFEMVFAGRPHRDLGKKLLAPGVVPLAGQAISSTDSLLNNWRSSTGRGLSIDGLDNGDHSYKTKIQQIFDERFWGDGSGGDVCLTSDGISVVSCTVDGGGFEVPNPDAAYTLMEWNFALFFGLAVQAYEATLTTEQTIIDLLVGGIATGNVTNQRLDNRGRVRATITVPVAGLPLEGCIAAVALANNAAAQGVAANLCIQHYAQFIHPLAVSGSASNATATPIPAGTAIGGCSGARATTTSAVNGLVTTPWCGTGDITDVVAAVTAIDRGMGRFFAGATGCSICHFNPEFTGATVAALTGFGAAPLPPLPPGQLRRIPLEVPMERMIAFNGAPAVYDAGFYNLGVRPTPEDISLGDAIGGVPLAFSKLAELILTPPPLPAPYDADKIAAIAGELGTSLFIPTSATDLTPIPWGLALACGPGLVGNGNGNGNNNPNAQCVPNVIPGERLLRNGAFKAQGLRNVKFTGPYFHNGSKLNLEQVVNFYETAGSFTTLNFNNLDAGLRIFDLGPTDTAALIEMMETGLTDWRLAHEEGKFDHPEICVPHGHSETGETVLVGIPAVGAGGNVDPLQTFQEQIEGISNTHDLTDACTVTGVAGVATLDTPPAPPPPPAP